MIRYYWICIFLCGYFWTKGQEKLAYQLMAQEQYPKAALAFERAFFEAKDMQERNRFLMLKAQCYKAIGDYEAGIRNLQRVRYLRGDSLKRAVNYEMILLYYLHGALADAQSRLIRMQATGGMSQEMLLLSFLVNVEQGKWAEARQLLMEQDTVFQLSPEDIEYILPEKLKLKDPRKAYNLSLLPGIGQWYAGYFWKGVLSGGIQALLGAFSIYSLVEGYFFTGTLTGVALFYTFYLGGARYAETLANRKNEERAGQIKERFFEKYDPG